MTRTIFIAAALAVSLAATSLARAETASIAITFTDGVIAPQLVEIPANTPVSLDITNTGKAAAEFESKKLHIEQVVAPGASVTIPLQPLPAGSYAFVEEFHETLDTARGTIVAK